MIDVQESVSIPDFGTLARSRARGCMIAALAGDSLGAQVEFVSTSAMRRKFPDGVRTLAPGGAHGLDAGQPTDDGEMALALARTLATKAHDLDAILAAYRRWAKSKPFTMGGTNAAALVDRRLDHKSTSNGSLMRAYPIALYGVGRGWSAEQVAAFAEQDSALTHPSEVCRVACGAFCLAVALAVAFDLDAASVWAAARHYARGRAGDDSPVVRAIEDAAISPSVARSRRRGADEADFRTTEEFLFLWGWPFDARPSTSWRMSGALVALRNAFHQAMFAPSLEDGMVRTVALGGDADTNATIAGALLGALHGEEAVPTQWRVAIERCQPRRNRPEEYYPNDAATLADRLVGQD